MKKIFVTLAVLSIVFVPAFAFAQNTNSEDSNTNTVLNTNTTNTNTTNTNSSLDNVAKTKVEQEAEAFISDPGILPDSPFYFLKEWGENIHLLFTSGDEKKSELEYRYALRKIAEAKKMVDKGKQEIAEKHLEKAEAKFTKVKNRLKTQIEGGKDVGALIAKLELIQARQQEVLLDVYEKAPDSAKEAILKAMENSAKGISNAIEKVKGGEGLEKFEQEIQTRIENHGQEMKLKVRTHMKGDETEVEIEEESETETETETETEVDESDDVNSNTNSSQDDEEDEEDDNSGSESNTNSSN